TVTSFLASRGITSLDYMICTHAHEDHCGGLTGVLEAYPVSMLYSPVTEYDSRAFENVVSAAEDQGLSITQPNPGSSFIFGSAGVEFIGPQREYEETNDTSIVIRIVYGETSFLFTGDAEMTAEHDMVDSGRPLHATVLKAGHHGSDTSSSYVFLREVMPEYVVISVGEDNSYGHPHDEAMSRFRDVGAQVLRTDTQGTVVINITGGKIDVRTER
ncbi:MAG: MBL fold metallo-hydrolase, partial [Clostridia bacterium]|nr:MBL fold metallo-hydrolase [Clostridia bacterium]